MDNPIRSARTAVAVLGSLVALLMGCREERAQGPRKPQSPMIRQNIEASVTAPVSGASVGDMVVISIDGINAGGQDLTGVQGAIRYDSTRLRFMGSLRLDSTRVFTRDLGDR